MNVIEKIYVKHFDCTTTEDIWDQGEVGNICSFWTNTDVGFFNPEQGFDSIENAIKAVCRSNYFKYEKKNWISFGSNFGENYGRFDGDFLVNEENAEATSDDIKKWKNKQKRLYACHINIQLEIRSIREITEEEANKF